MMVVKLGWDSTFVMPVKDAVTLAEILQKAYSWKEEYRSTEQGGPVYYAYPTEAKAQMELIHDDLFNMAKLAGKPEKK